MSLVGKLIRPVRFVITFKEDYNENNMVIFGPSDKLLVVEQLPSAKGNTINLIVLGGWNTSRKDANYMISAMSSAGTEELTNHVNQLIPRENFNLARVTIFDVHIGNDFLLVEEN